MKNKVKKGFYLIKHLGCGWLLFRICYRLKAASGYLVFKTPIKNWCAITEADFILRSEFYRQADYFVRRQKTSPKFFFDFDNLHLYASFLSGFDQVGMASLLHFADNIGKGIFRFFSHTDYELGFPPVWHHNVISGEDALPKVHWSRLSDFAFGDIKVIWEPNRFAFTYVLVRAYWHTKNEQYAEWFWQLLENWAENNQPNTGVNWKCGQEISVRVMAWCFGLYGFLHAAATTPQRLMLLAKMIAVSGKRIEQNIGYALSQNNNHGISEALGLFTIGLLFPEFNHAEKWRNKGRFLLEQQASALIYDDGSFSQHSFNYHRVMLQAYLWVMQLADLNMQPFSAGLKGRVKKAMQFLLQFVDIESGAVPNYGSNDGALILPLNSCDYNDYRPILQALYYYFNRRKCFAAGLWDEDLFWLFGPESINAQVVTEEKSDLHANFGGYYIFRNKDGYLFTRSAKFKHRPGHADMLGVDVFWRGMNVLRDIGTYSYNPKNQDRSYASSLLHNVVAVDDQDQMDSAGRFLWLPWEEGKVLDKASSIYSKLLPADASLVFAATHDGYERLPLPVHYQKEIFRINEECWLIVDILKSSGEHKYRLNYFLADCPYDYDKDLGTVLLCTPKVKFHIQVGLFGTIPEYFLGMAEESRYYYQKSPLLRFATTIKAKEVVFWTVLGTSPISFNAQNLVG